MELAVIPNFSTEPAVIVTRGGYVESVHQAAVAVVRSDGTLLYSLGDPGLVTFTRSSAKPFQALAVVESGALDEYGFMPRELALMCASHNGQPYHTQTATQMLERIGLTADDLRCGVHMPFHAPTAKAMRQAGERATPIHNNCSGKHAGMLALSKYLGALGHDYRDLAHPVQQMNLANLAELAEVAPESITVAVDGCSVPTFGLPLRDAAYAFSRLMDTRGLPPARADAIERIVGAMQAYPEMVGGDDRFDTWLMSSIPGLISKIGAEGYQGMAIRRDGEALGIAARIADGDVPNRAQAALVMEVLRQLDLLPPGLAGAERWQRGVVRNRHGTEVGDIRPAFELRHL